MWYHGFLDNHANVPDSTADYITTDTGGPWGNYMEIGEYVDPAQGVVQTAGFIFQGLTYNPQTQGAITSIRYDVDAINLLLNQYPTLHQDVYVAPAVVQDGSIFSLPPMLDMGNEYGVGWMHLSDAGGPGSWWGWYFSGAVPNLVNGDPIQFGLVIETDHSYDIVRSGLGFDNFSVSITHDAPAQTSYSSSVSQMSLLAAPANNASFVINETPVARTPSTLLTATFSDPNASGATGTATINWGDGTTSAGNFAANGTNYTVTGTHVYATNRAFSPSVTAVYNYAGPTGPSTATATSAPATFNIGLQVDAGNLDDYTGGASPTLLDSQVQFYLVRNSDGTVFSLHKDGTLFSISSSSKTQIDTDVETISLAADGTTLQVQHRSNLAGGGSAAGIVIPSLEDQSGTVYDLDLDGSLYGVLPGSGSMSKANQGNLVFKSIALDFSGAAVNVVDTAGNAWQYDGLAWTFLQGPHLSLSTPASVTAGQTVAVRLSVLDFFNNPVTGYVGTVHFTSTDGARRRPIINSQLIPP